MKRMLSQINNSAQSIQNQQDKTPKRIGITYLVLNMSIFVMKRMLIFLRFVCAQILLIPTDLPKYLEIGKITINKDEWAFPLFMHMGDNYLICALAEAFVEKHGGKFVVVCPSKYEPIAKMFPKVSRIVISNRLPSCFMFHIVAVVLKVLPYTLREIVIDRILIPCKGKLLMFLYPSKNICVAESFVNAIKIVLDLPIEAKFSTPQLPSKEILARVESRFKELNLPKGKTAILCPISYSAPLLDQKYWHVIRDRLRELGWTVVTNVTGNEKHIEGTQAISILIEEIFATAETAGWVIGVRNGFFDLISYANCRKTIITTFSLSKAYRPGVKYSITILPSKGMIEEFDVNDFKNDPLELKKLLAVKEKT